MRFFTMLSLCVCALLSITTVAHAQLTSFQKLYLTEHFTTCFDIAPTLDQGYIITGFEDRPAPFNMPLVPYLAKIDCRGEMEWMKKFGFTTNIDNTDPAVSVLDDGDYVMMSTVQLQNYDILVTRTTPDGDAVWQKRYGGPQKDVGRGMLKLADDHLVVVGSTQSYGTDIDGSPYSDMYAIKINSSTGDTIWTKTYGNPDGIDDLWALVENPDGELTFVGRSFHSAGIWLSLIHTDSRGDIIWSKVLGKTNHHAQGFDIQSFPNGDLIVTGFTTLAKVDFNSISDAPVLRLDAEGNIIWSTVLHGSAPDLGEVASTIIIHGSTVAVSVESYSYPTPSADLTKRMLYLLDAQTGALQRAVAFNGSGGQFPMIKKDWEGYIMSGFTDEFDGSWNDPILVKMDGNFNSGCEEADLTSLTVAENPDWDLEAISYSVLQGGDPTDYTIDSIGTVFRDSTLCFTGIIPMECEMISSTEELNKPVAVTVFPNPTSNEVQLTFTTQPFGVKVLELYNLQGALLQKNVVSNNSTTLDLRPYPTGTYLLKIGTEMGVGTEKIIKQ